MAHVKALRQEDPGVSRGQWAGTEEVRREVSESLKGDMGLGSECLSSGCCSKLP